MTDHVSTAPGIIRRVRPPTPDSAPSPGAVGALPYVPLRPTARQRPWIRPRLGPEPAGRTFPADHPYVRRFWTAAIGPGAVADLLRLATAARRGRSLRRPIHLEELVAIGLVVAVDDASPLVVRTVPELPRALWRRLTPALRREHSTACR